MSKLLPAAIEATLAAAFGVIEDAVPILIKAALKSPKLYRELTEPQLQRIAYDVLRQESRAQRRIIVEVASTPVTGDNRRPGRLPPSIQEYGEENILCFLSLPGAGYLKDANRPQRLAAIEHYTKQAATETRLATFLTAVDKRAGNRITRTVLNGAQLQKIWDDLP